MTNITILTICAAIGYLLGSIPFGLALTRISGHGDIRKIGSGNIGATNVLRATGSKTLTLLTILLDAFKAAIAAYIAFLLIPNPMKDIFIGDSIIYITNIGTVAALTAGTFAIIGHNFPVWLKFKGGKGVASAFGFILIMTPIVALLALLTWIVVAIVSRYSSLSAITAALLVPLYTWFFAPPICLLFYIPIVALILVRHNANFKRLFKGEETKITFKKKS